MYDDDRMLERLALALAPPEVRPSGAEVQMMRRVAAFLHEHLMNTRARTDAHVYRADRAVTQLPPVVLAESSSCSRTPSKVTRRRRLADIRFIT